MSPRQTKEYAFATSIIGTLEGEIPGTGPDARKQPSWFTIDLNQAGAVGVRVSAAGDDRARRSKPTSARDPNNAKLFVRFMLRPENSAMSTNFTHYASAITGNAAYLDAALRDAPELKVPGGTKIVFTPTCPEAAIRLMDRVWTKLKR